MKINHLFLFCLIILSCQDKRTSEQIISDIHIQIDNSKYQSALSDLNKLINKGIQTTDVYLLKGISENGLDKNSESLLSFQKSIELDDKNYLTYVERAKLKIKLGDYRGAIEDCNNAMIIQRNYAKTYVTKAKAYEFLGDEPNSIIQYQSAIEYGDDSGENNYKLGILFLNKGNTIEGCEFLSKAGEKGFIKAYEDIKKYCNKVISNEIFYDKNKAFEEGYQVFENDNFMIKCDGELKLDKLRIEQILQQGGDKKSKPYHVYNQGFDYNVLIQSFDPFLFEKGPEEMLDYHQTKFNEMSITNKRINFKHYDALYYENEQDNKKTMAIFFIHKMKTYTLQVTGNYNVKEKFEKFTNSLKIIND